MLLLHPCEKGQMRLPKKVKTVVASEKEKFKLARAKGNMQTTDVQANTVPHSDGLSEDMRNAAPTSEFDPNFQRNGSLSGPLSTAASLNTGPPVPPHATPSFSATNAPGDDALSSVRPTLPRKPTQSEDMPNKNPKPSEKQLPSLNSNLSQEPTLSEELLKNNDGKDETPAHRPEMTGISGQTLGGPVAEQQSAKLQEHAREIKALQDSNDQHVDEIEKLKDDLRKERHRHAETTQEWRKATMALSANRPEANYKVDDDTLQKDYQNIAYEIESWVINHCVRNFDRVPESHSKIFNVLTPDPGKYDKAERTRELLLQSLIMHLLVELVLNRKLLWAGKHSSALRKVQEALEPDAPQLIPTMLRDKSIRLADVRDYSAWKAKTALLLSEKVKGPAVQANVGNISADMQDFLKPFVQRNISTAWKELEAVIYKTIALDLEFSKSRALFQVHRWSKETVRGLKFEEQGMVSPNGLKAAQSGMDVELILAPMITKTGNADGEAFEHLYLFSPWTVVCYENRKQIQKR